MKALVLSLYKTFRQCQVHGKFFSLDLDLLRNISELEGNGLHSYGKDTPPPTKFYRPN